MKVVHTKDIVSLETRLNEVVAWDSLNVKVVQTTHRKYELRKSSLFLFWITAASIDIYKETIVVNENDWKKYKLHIESLAEVIEAHYTIAKKPIEMTIEVRP